MKVQLRDIPCSKAIEVGASFVAEALAGLPMRVALERPAEDPDAGFAKVDFQLYLEGRNVFARGHFVGEAQVACSRCIGLAVISIDEELLVTFLPRPEVDDDEEPVELADGEEEEAKFEEDDVDVYPYDDEEIDLEPLIRERVVLAVPYAPLCREDCKGLCTVCGIDLNRESCTCDRHVVDPRLAALKDLKV